MDIFSIITLLGGLAFFLYGMTVMSNGLEKSANDKLNKNLKMVTKNKIVALIFGAGMTIAVQSSSAVTVMLVGLVNSGILEFGQTIGVLMGSNIGTTLTAWILSLAGIESDVLWLNLLKPKNFAPLFAFIGIILIMMGKKDKHKSLGEVLVGFAVLMTGMNLMSGAMEPLADMPEFASLLVAFKNPILAVVVGAAFTGIIQSSAASVAILQALSMTGGITYGIAIPIIMGQNIGTCVTAVISSIGVSRNAKKVAVVHLSFNIIGTLICLIPFCVGSMIFEWAFVDMRITPFMIAIVHSIFNVVTTFILLPFTKQLEWIANTVIKDLEEKEDKPMVLLDERLLEVPSVAVEESMDVVMDMFKMAKDAFFKSTALLNNFTQEGFDEITNLENKIDHYEDEIGTYMMKVSKVGVSEQDAKRVTRILHTIDDFERMGDHAENVAESAKELFDKGIEFSSDAKEEVAKITLALHEIMELTLKAFETNDIEVAKAVEPLEEVIDILILKAKNNHINRLQRGECTMELGFTLSDILTGYERVSDHCSNVAIAVIEAQRGSFDEHHYMESLNAEENEEFKKMFKEYSDKFIS